MNDIKQLHDAMASAVRHQILDGSAELGVGVMFLCYGAACYLFGSAESSPPILAWVTLFAGGGAPLSVAFFVKRTLVWPTTGHAVPWREPLASAKWATIVAVLAAVVVAGVILSFIAARAGNGQSEADLAIALLLRWAMVVAFLVWPVLYWRISLPLSKGVAGHRWRPYMVMLMVLGLFLVGFFVSGNYLRVATAAFCLLGATWLVSGSISLFLFLRRARSCGHEIL